MSLSGKVYYPSSLLTRSNAKTIKGEKFHWETYILYMAPHKQNVLGKNLCPHASKGCAAACLYSAGRGKFSNVIKGRMNKTTLFLTQRDWFMNKLIKELTLINIKDVAVSDIVPFYGTKKKCVRLNGTTDIPWENITVNGKNIFQMFPNLQFYDYTKSVKRVLNNNYSNYHLTFSRSEDNNEDCIKVLEAGYNVAAVFDTSFYKTYLNEGNSTVYTLKNKNFNVIDGDTSDLRFLDKKEGVIVGLKSKGDASKDTTGFVLH